MARFSHRSAAIVRTVIQSVVSKNQNNFNQRGREACESGFPDHAFAASLSGPARDLIGATLYVIVSSTYNHYIRPIKSSAFYLTNGFVDLLTHYKMIIFECFNPLKNLVTLRYDFSHICKGSHNPYVSSNGRIRS